MSRVSRVMFVVAALAMPLLAQQKLDGRAFIPIEPQCEIWADFRAMRDNGVWDGISRSLAGTLLPLAERQLGFRLAELDRVRAYPQNGPSQEGRNDTGVVIFEGNDSVVTPAGAPETKTEQIGGCEVVVVESWWAKDDPNLWVAPRPGLLVYGARHFVEPVLLGKQQPGVTPPELLSLVAGRGVLAHAVLTFDDAAKQGFLQMFDADARAIAPDFVMLRMRIDPATAADGEPVVHLDGKLRWATAENGPQQLHGCLRTQLEGLKKHPRYAALKKIWNLIELGIDGRDVTVHVDLGRPREAGALFALAAPLLMFTAVAVQPVQLQAVQVEAVPVEVPPPGPPPGPLPPPGNGGQRQNGGGR